MKFENLLLCVLFVICMLLCVTALSSMLLATPTNAGHRLGTRGVNASAIMPMACPLLPDGVLCLRHD